MKNKSVIRPYNRLKSLNKFIILQIFFIKKAELVSRVYRQYKRQDYALKIDLVALAVCNE
jgi:hypothetical protein